MQITRGSGSADLGEISFPPLFRHKLLASPCKVLTTFLLFQISDLDFILPPILLPTLGMDNVFFGWIFFHL